MKGQQIKLSELCHPTPKQKEGIYLHYFREKAPNWKEDFHIILGLLFEVFIFFQYYFSQTMVSFYWGSVIVKNSLSASSMSRLFTIDKHSWGSIMKV